MSKIIETLKIQRNTWKDVTLYGSYDEAKSDGLGIMYDDNEGTVYGSTSGGGHWDKIGFVPYRKKNKKYATIAKDTAKEYDNASVLKIGSIDVVVVGGKMSEKEMKAYVDRATTLYPEKPITAMNIAIVDDENVDIEYHYDTTPFQRIRRVTGYLAGTLDRFNNAKQAEVRDRVTHDVNTVSDFEDVYIDEAEEADADELSL